MNLCVFSLFPWLLSFVPEHEALGTRVWISSSRKDISCKKSLCFAMTLLIDTKSQTRKFTQHIRAGDSLFYGWCIFSYCRSSIMILWFWFTFGLDLV